MNAYSPITLKEEWTRPSVVLTGTLSPSSPQNVYIVDLKSGKGSAVAES